MIKYILIIALFAFSTATAAVENVAVSHPVYIFLSRFEAMGVLEHKSLSSLPLQQMEIEDCLKLIDARRSELSVSEIRLLDMYLKEFCISDACENAVVFYSPSDSTQVFSSELFSNKEKYIYRYSYDSTKISLVPLAAMDNMFDISNKERSHVGTLGVRFYGTLTNSVGFKLQATNGRLISGSRALASEDINYAKSIKFTRLEDDIDFSESHLNYRNKWFFASIAKETKLEGAGLDQRAFISDVSPNMDALTLAAKFSNFEYSFMHGSLIAQKDGEYDMGFLGSIPPKYMAFHKIAVRPSWGEVALVEQVIYSNRYPELAYLNPIGFLKSIEHSLHDRDNSLMGLFFTVRPFARFQLKGSYLLDDIIFEKVGTGYWSNKMAYNFSAEYALPRGIDIGAEYARVEPFTYSHFNVQNSVTNDGKMVGSNLLPNSDRIMLRTRYWWGERYPLELKFSFTRHGRNIFQGDSLIYNAGGDPLQTRRSNDPMEIDFLTGDVQREFAIELSTAYELFRSFYVIGYLRHSNINGLSNQSCRIIFRFGEF